MKHAYPWVPWFRELAEKISQGGESYLADRARRVDWGEKKHALLEYAGENDKNIDPFSFFYSLAQKNGTKLHDRVYGSVHKVFQLSSEIPSTENEKACPLPTPFPPMTCFFAAYTGDFCPEVLWRLFRQAVDTKAGETKIDPRDFAEALDIKNVAVRKLTQTLFLMNPYYFLPVDGATGVWSKCMLDTPIEQIEKRIRNAGYNEYISIISKIKPSFPECHPYEIYFLIYRGSKMARLVPTVKNSR